MPNTRPLLSALLLNTLHTMNFEIRDFRNWICCHYFLWKVCSMASINCSYSYHLIGLFFVSVAYYCESKTKHDKRRTSDSDQIRNTVKQINNNLWLNTNIKSFRFPVVGLHSLQQIRMYQLCARYSFSQILRLRFIYHCINILKPILWMKSVPLVFFASPFFKSQSLESLVFMNAIYSRFCM